MQEVGDAEADRKQRELSRDLQAQAASSAELQTQLEAVEAAAQQFKVSSLLQIGQACVQPSCFSS